MVFVARYVTIVDINDIELLHQAAAVVWKASASLANFHFRYFKYIEMLLVFGCGASLES